MQPIAADDVRVWYRFTESLQHGDLRALSEVLSAAERLRCGRFMFAHDRREFAAAHALLRQTLSRYGSAPPSEWRFETARLGKPAIVADQAGGLAFNLSHTRGLVACVVARGTDVGLDVEAIHHATARRNLATRCFSAVENEHLDACPADRQPQRFIECWTLKEAYLKALGTGLSEPLDTFSLTLDGDGGICFVAPAGTAPWWQFALAAPAPRFRLAVAVRRAVPHQRYRITLHDAGAPDGGAPVALLASTADGSRALQPSRVD